MKFNTKDHPRHFLEKKRYIENKTVCNLCEEEIHSGSFFPKKTKHSGSTFHCFTCESHFHESCLTIDDRGAHDHPLFFIRRQTSVVCDVCGLVGTDHKINMYTCVPCDFFVHRNCILLPMEIKITRHLHSLYRTIITDEKNCKICRESVSLYYNVYTCRERRCDYVAHAFCATRSEVWDKQEPKIVGSWLLDDDDHVEIDGIAIDHFSHNHKLTRVHHGDDAAQEKMSGSQVCQSCILPIDMGSFLYCKQCGFSLHDTCGRLPQWLDHMLHRHQLVLEVTSRTIKEGVFTCSVCNQDSCGYMYRCSIRKCKFYMDVKCASFVEPFNHTAHQHPLFLEQQFDNNGSYKCMACGDLSSTFIAICSDPHCHFSLDFKCATLPGRLFKCSYDSHPLTLSLARIDDVHQNALTSSFWCEMCEENIMKTNLLIYTCDVCCTTIHVECLLGKHRYIKPGHTIKMKGVEFYIVSNKGSAAERRPCHECQRICQDELVFIRRYPSSCFCSTNCLRSFVKTCPLPLIH